MASLDDFASARSVADLLGKCGPIALFLDFDGVIAEIAPTPDTVHVPGTTISRLQSLNSALYGALAVVSGRKIDALDTLLAPLSLAVAGDHGNARRRSDGQVIMQNEPAARAAFALAGALRERFAGDSRIIVEAKPSAVAVHYRLAPERADECLEAVRASIEATPELTMIEGKMVVEARALGVDKGTAVRGFMSEAPFIGRTPIFVGDDVTDEDGFVAAQEAGGVGIKVGTGDTVALFRIGSTADVPTLLDTIIKRDGWN